MYQDPIHVERQPLVHGKTRFAAAARAADARAAVSVDLHCIGVEVVQPRTLGASVAVACWRGTAERAVIPIIDGHESCD